MLYFWCPVIIVLLLVGVAPASAEPIPSSAKQYQRELTRQVQMVWGLGGPTALHAAQVHAESTWRADVDSPMGAQGLAQFMPGTSQWVAELHPELGVAAPYSPRWALAAMTRYNRRLYDGIRPLQADDIPQCDRFAMMLAAYNGGQGWLARDRALAAAADLSPDRWWQHTELTTARADWAERENRNYPRKILFELEPLYLRGGWRGQLTCEVHDE